MSWHVSVPSSGDYQFLLDRLMLFALLYIVSVPSSGDYQFLLQEIDFREIAEKFPSPHPGIINFFW